jgi:hypothetical protein
MEGARKPEFARKPAMTRAFSDRRARRRPAIAAATV